jgi:hypothetical protein
MKNFTHNNYDRRDRKLYISMGPFKIYRNLALLTFYTPYWRKICRMLSTMRRMRRFNFKDDPDRYLIEYAVRSYWDTKLPPFVKILLRDCIWLEFKIDVDPK